MTEFLRSATAQEAESRTRLEGFISTTLERAQRAEDETQRLRARLALAPLLQETSAKPPLQVPYPLVYKTHLFVQKGSTITGAQLCLTRGLLFLLFQSDPMPENQGKSWGASCTWVRLILGGFGARNAQVGVRW